MDPEADLTVDVRRWTPEGQQRLELPDGKSWRLPRRGEIGLRIADGVAFAPDGYDPGRMHRWVRIT